MPDATIPAGWPCALLPIVPPSVADRQSNPSANDLLPQVLALTPRGAAFGRDEAGDGKGAGPVMRRFWRAVAAWVADINARDFEVAAQTFPSAATIALTDWETELGLPDTCMPAGQTVEQRVRAIRARFGALGGASPAYYVCVAASLGYTVRVEEPTQFLCDVSECCDDDADGDEVAGTGISESAFVCSDDGTGSEIGLDGDPLEGFDLGDPDADVRVNWIVHVDVGPNTSLACSDDDDGGQVGDDGDPLEGFVPAPDLECVLRALSPPHTELSFAYGGD